MGIAHGGTGQSTAQAAIDALSAVGAATNEHVLTKDTGTGNAIWKVATGGSDAFTVKIDADATAGYIGNSSVNGVLRLIEHSGLSYTYEGDYITLGVDITDLNTISTGAINYVSDFLMLWDTSVPAMLKKVTPGALGILKDIGAKVYRNTAFSIPNATVTAIPFDKEHYDTDVIHDNSTHNTRLTCKTAGKYRISGGFDLFNFASGAGFAWIVIVLNGTTNIGGVGFEAGTSYYPRLSVSTEYELAVNDYVELKVYQNNGVALNLIVSTPGLNQLPHFEMRRVA